MSWNSQIMKLSIRPMAGLFQTFDPWQDLVSTLVHGRTCFSKVLSTLSSTLPIHEAVVLVDENRRPARHIELSLQAHA